MATSDYEVGYKKPPTHSQFKKGQKRPPRKKPAVETTNNAHRLFWLVLQERQRATIGGKSGMRSTAELVLRLAIQRALAGNITLLNLLSELLLADAPPEGLTHWLELDGEIIGPIAW